MGADSSAEERRSSCEYWGLQQKQNNNSWTDVFLLQIIARSQNWFMCELCVDNSTRENNAIWCSKVWEAFNKNTKNSNDSPDNSAF